MFALSPQDSASSEAAILAGTLDHVNDTPTPTALLSRGSAGLDVHWRQGGARIALSVARLRQVAGKERSLQA